MTATLLSLLYMLLGILGANITLFKIKKYSFGLVGNCIAGVFGSILLIKVFEHLIHLPWLLAVLSILSGLAAVISFKILVTKIQKK